MAITFQRLDGRQAAAHEGELRVVHREVYGAADQGAVFAGRLRVWRRQRGFVLAEARHGDYLVGFAAGMPLRSSTSWWKGLITAALGRLVTRVCTMTFAVVARLICDTP
jgi:predicted GNAT superfamily acetyltransferase